MTKRKRLIIFIAINVILPLLAISLVMFSKIVSITPYAERLVCPSLIEYGIYCPFCGTTRAIEAILCGKLITAFIYNPAFVFFIPCFIYYDIVSFVAIIKEKEKLPKIRKWVAITLIAILLAYWIFRNALLLIWGIDYTAVI